MRRQSLPRTSTAAVAAAAAAAAAAYDAHDAMAPPSFRAAATEEPSVPTSAVVAAAAAAAAVAAAAAAAVAAAGAVGAAGAATNHAAAVQTNAAAVPQNAFLPTQHHPLLQPPFVATEEAAGLELAALDARLGAKPRAAALTVPAVNVLPAAATHGLVPFPTRPTGPAVPPPTDVDNFPGGDGGLGSGGSGTPHLGRACASPFDWNDTLLRVDQATPGGGSVSSYDLLPSPPQSPRSHRAWSTSAVPDRPSAFPSMPATAGMVNGGAYGSLTPGSAGSLAGSTPGSAFAVSSNSNSGAVTPGSGGNGYMSGGSGDAGGASMMDDRGLSLRVDLDKVFSGEEVRTTVMVRNIPNKYTAAQLRAVLDSVCPGGYDYLYLPMDFSSHCNVGYAFVNFSTKEGLMRFHRHQDGRRWELHHSDKLCELRFARIQGREALIQEHQKQFAKHGHRKSRPVVATRPGQGHGV